MFFAQVLSAKSPVPIKTIEGKHVRGIEKYGTLNDESVYSILEILISNKYVDLPVGLMDLKRVEACFKVKALGEGVKGVHTGQIFAISYNRGCLSGEAIEDKWQGLYILKQTTKGMSEIENLHRVITSPLGQEKIATKVIIDEHEQTVTHEKARISFEDIHFKIIYRNKIKYYSLLQMARGKGLQSILVGFGDTIKNMSEEQIYQSNEFSRMKRMFYRIGFASSKLHQSYAVHKNPYSDLIGKTYIHGDYHAQNIFYDETTEEVTLIDNETFSMSLERPKTGVKDIVDLYLLHTVHTIAHTFAKQLLINSEMGINDVIWHELWKELLKGYLQAFASKAAMFQAYEELVEKFTKGLSNNWVFRDPHHNLTDQRFLKMLGPSLRRVTLRIHLKDHFFPELHLLLVKR